MDKKKPLPIKSKTGAVVTLATLSDPIPEEGRAGECRPETEAYLQANCLPDVTCAPDTEPVSAEKECPDFACCPEKDQQDCEPNV